MRSEAIMRCVFAVVLKYFASEAGMTVGFLLGRDVEVEGLAWWEDLFMLLEMVLETRLPDEERLLVFWMFGFSLRGLAVDDGLDGDDNFDEDVDGNLCAVLMLLSMDVGCLGNGGWNLEGREKVSDITTAERLFVLDRTFLN